MEAWDSPDARLARIEAELDGVRRLVETFGPTARQALETDLRTQELTRNLADFRSWLEDVEDRLADRIAEVSSEVHTVRSDLQTREDARADARTKIIVAAIAGTATVVVGFLTALATILNA